MAFSFFAVAAAAANPTPAKTLANDQVDAGDYNEFRWSLSEMYSREVLIGMGRRAIQPVRVLLKGVAEEEDAVFYEAEVVWTCGARDVSDVAAARARFEELTG